MNDNIIQISFPQASYAEQIKSQKEIIDGLKNAFDALCARHSMLCNEADMVGGDIERISDEVMEQFGGTG